MTTPLLEPGSAGPWIAPAAGDDPAVAGRGAMSGLEAGALAATRAAALACSRWLGRGDAMSADGAATDAMRAALAQVAGTGTVVIGEGEKDAAPMLYNGERVGAGGAPEFDIAVDPLECTKLCAAGLPGALATIAFAEAGSMWSPGPAFYMDKLVAPPAARGVIQIDAAPEQNLKRVAEALGKRVQELRVVVLDKPRHEALIARLHADGVQVIAPPDGDVAGSLAVLLPDGGADLLMGIGGTPEGVMTACAARALGGAMQGRLAPQKKAEATALSGVDGDLTRVLELDDLVSGDAFFVATGVTGGLLRGVVRERGAVQTESIVIAAGAIRHVLEISPPGPAADGGEPQHPPGGTMR